MGGSCKACAAGDAASPVRLLLLVLLLPVSMLRGPGATTADSKAVHNSLF